MEQPELIMKFLTAVPGKFLIVSETFSRISLQVPEKGLGRGPARRRTNQENPSKLWKS